jgi:tetratricopeptide (TPR) repeat protein
VLALVSALLPLLLVYILIYAVMTRYTLEVLILTSEGDLTPPSINPRAPNANFVLVLKQWITYAVLGAIIFVLAGSGMALLASLSSLIFLLLLPSMIMVLASTRSLSSAFNPALVLGMVTRIGWSYLALFGLLFIVYMAEYNLEDFLLSRVGEWAVYPLYHALNLFFSVMAYHMMGYLLYQNHAELGISQRKNDDEPVDTTESKLDLFYTYMNQGLLDAAKAELLGRAKQEPADSKLVQKAATFLMVNGSEKERLEFARYFIPILLETERGNLAATLFQDLVMENPEFSMRQADHYLRLIRALAQEGQEKVAVNLSKNIHKRFPNAPEVGDIYIETARILSLKFNRDDLARKLLGFVMKQFPQHPRRHEAIQLSETIQQINSG